MHEEQLVDNVYFYSEQGFDVSTQEDKILKGCWRVEAINMQNDGEIYITIFAGPKAEERAREYARCKYR